MPFGRRCAREASGCTGRDESVGCTEQRCTRCTGWDGPAESCSLFTAYCSNEKDDDAGVDSAALLFLGSVTTLGARVASSVNANLLSSLPRSHPHRIANWTICGMSLPRSPANCVYSMGELEALGAHSVGKGMQGSEGTYSRRLQASCSRSTDPITKYSPPPPPAHLRNALLQASQILPLPLPLWRRAYLRRWHNRNMRPPHRCRWH
jgi:hypothetical protein